MRIRTVLMDLDGTVYRGNELIDGALEAIGYIRSRGWNLFFFTNNSEKNRRQISDKLNGMGVSCDERDVVSSGFVAAPYVLKKGYGKVFLSGSDSLREEFTRCGVELVEEDQAETLVIGMDTKFDFAKMKRALNAALRAKHIVACNVERNYPCGNGMTCPGNGALVSSVMFSSGREIDEIIGKPNTPMLDYVMDVTGSDYGEIVVVGDVYDSDVVLAERCHARSVLIGSNHAAKVRIDTILELPHVLQKLDQDISR